MRQSLALGCFFSNPFGCGQYSTQNGMHRRQDIVFAVSLLVPILVNVLTYISAMYPSSYNPTFALAFGILAMIIASAFSLLFPIIGPAAVLLIFLTLVGTRFQNENLHEMLIHPQPIDSLSATCMFAPIHKRAASSNSGFFVALLPSRHCSLSSSA
jgi:sorbitol-specific phosphotransferase system component IIBC